MNTESWNRLLEAGKYQRKAIRALFPEEMQGHIDVITGELKEMCKESMIKFLQSEEGMNLVKNVMTATGKKESEQKESDSKVKKVKID